ncbi:DEAD/DEAH box helicase [uncultured Fusobacterium sp.]|uniref:DEAD/DEAH box helicase n=1 Tax=uncultured Fusobacterium sp. TaxID=159267 RepID=UPI0025F0B520|nr:DEAD/DEAH box helicase [uncultured Fusobacterium sp.]
MLFLNDLKIKTRDIVYERGEKYFRARRARILDVVEYTREEVEDFIENWRNGDFRQTIEEKMLFATPYYFSGEVSGSSNYIVELIMTKENILGGTCDCIYHLESGQICKHMVALALQVDKEGCFEDMLPNKKKYDLDFFEVETSNRTVPLKLEVGYSIFTPYWRDLPSMQFSLELVTPNKRYKLDSKLEKFITAYKNNEEFYFGKGYTYNPKTDYFLEKSKKILKYLCKFVAYSKDLRDSSIFGREGKVYLIKEYAEKMLEILHEEKKVEIIDTPLNKILNIEILENKINDSIDLKFKDLLDYEVLGDRYIINRYSNGRKVFKLSEEDAQRLEKIILNYDINGLSFKSSKSSEIIRKASNIGRIELCKSLQKLIYIPQKIEEKIYIDSLGEFGVEVHNKIFYDGQEERELSDKVVLSDIQSNESSFYKELMEKYGENFVDNRYQIESLESVYNFITEGIPQLKDRYEVYYSEKLKKRKYSTVSYHIQTKVTDILEINFSIEGIDKGEVQNFLNSVKEKSRYYRLKDGGILKIDNLNDLERLNEMLDIADASIKEIENGIISREKNYIYFIKSTLEKIKNITLDEEFKKIDYNLKNIVTKKEIEDIKKEFPILRNYQREGVIWLKTLKKLGLGGILADDMGLGKTLQTIAYLVLERKEKPSIIVAPKSLIYNWKNEFEKFAPNVSVKVCIGSKKEREKIIKELENDEILITTYGTLKNDIDFYNREFSNIILDEAQAIKNILGKISNIIKTLKGETKIALTGTPIENNILELWNIFDFSFPGYLGSHTSFKNRFMNNLKNLREIISPFILRRTKKEVLKELPEKIEKDILIDLDDKQKKLYLGYQEKYRKEVENDKSDTIKIFSYITRLRQLCNHPKLFLDDYSGGSSKLEVLVELLETAKENGHRVLLFSQFTEMLDIIKKGLKDKFTILYLDGKTSAKNRIDLVERFNNGEGDIFIISLKAGGSGLNLVGADTVIHFDPWWNPSVENQATDRAHRLGQKNSVTVYRLITKGTIEEKINLIKSEKSKIISEVLEGEKKNLLNLNREELLKLF